MKRDIVTGSLLAATGIFVVWRSLTLSYLDEFGPGPGFLPRWMGLLLTVLAASLVVSAVRSRVDDAATRSDRRGLLRVFIAASGLIAVAAALEWTGFFAGFAVLSFFLVYIVERRSLAASIAVSASMTLGFFLIFRLILPLPLPVGAWGF
jgi:hypothetical protein